MSQFNKKKVNYIVSLKLYRDGVLHLQQSCFARYNSCTFKIIQFLSSLWQQNAYAAIFVWSQFPPTTTQQTSPDDNSFPKPSVRELKADCGACDYHSGWISSTIGAENRQQHDGQEGEGVWIEFVCFRQSKGISAMAGQSKASLRIALPISRLTLPCFPFQVTKVLAKNKFSVFFYGTGET